MIGDDEVDRLLRLIAERRQELVEQLATGSVPSDNVSGGYRETSGRIIGLDTANDLVRDVFRGWLPEPPPKPQPPRRIPDY